MQVTSPFINEVAVLLIRVSSFVFFAITLLLEGITGMTLSLLLSSLLSIFV